MRTISRTYEGLNRLTSAAESPSASFTYTYNAIGNRTDGGRIYNASLPGDWLHLRCRQLDQQWDDNLQRQRTQPRVDGQHEESEA